ncbi:MULTISPECIES: DUF4145 domain-containing protein [Pseudomonas]|uniref:DUF4145 domain-containing protein n=1 Tax=Pseudomonas TaxID=286 RepID=UPI0008637953|nr:MULTISPECIES: DUF4145 domain-containing protein [Pseudomonas]
MKTFTINSGKATIEVDAVPDFCPICHVGISPNFITGLSGRSNEEADLLFVCPKTDCRRMFIAVYRKDPLRSWFILRALQPRIPKAAAVVEEIREISPQHAEIFSQAYQAEAYGLGEIAGVGYRKSLEYLIKDYCVAQHPEKEDEIKKQPISQVIDRFVSNENIKQCAKRAVWIGNDETHYVRKWVDKDIKDLKLLIQITVSWIQQEVITKKLLEDMQ